MFTKKMPCVKILIWREGDTMQLHFTKMEGLGNDYVYINCLKEQITNPTALSRKISDRHFGIGADGLILIKPSDRADFAMEMYNADGSSGAMCGNGIRCVGKYVYDYGLTDKEQLTIETNAGIRSLTLHFAAPETKENQSRKYVCAVTVQMGCPILDVSLIGLNLQGRKTFIDTPIVVGTSHYNVSCVSMGNPHCVLFVDDVADAPVHSVGPYIEHLPMFIDRTNVEFVQIMDTEHIHLRVWERGSGETMACGTGACAAMVVSRLLGKTKSEVEVTLSGGKLFVAWNHHDDNVYMTGPASTVYDGVIQI